MLSSLNHPTLSKSMGASFLILQPEIWDFRFPVLLCTSYDGICIWGEAMGGQRVGVAGSKNSLPEVFPDGSVGKESTCNAGDPGSIPGLGRSPGEGIGYPLQHSWASLAAQLVKNLSAVRETWVRSLGGKILWSREGLPTPVFWPGEFHGLYSPWGHKESDTTEWLSLSLLSLVFAGLLVERGFSFSQNFGCPLD